MSLIRARRISFRWPVAVVAVALVMIAFGGVADAAGRFDANDAARVDGKQAVSASARVSVREGKLVATSKTTGRLPNDIIAEAPNSARLGGHPLRQVEAFSMPVQAAFVEGGATVNEEGVTLPGGQDTTMILSFILPPAYVSGDPINADIVYDEESHAACTWDLITDGLNGPGTGNSVTNGGWTSAGWNGAFQGIVHRPDTTGTGFRLSFGWHFAERAGDFVQFEITRLGTHTPDTCGNVIVDALQIRY